MLIHVLFDLSMHKELGRLRKKHGLILGFIGTSTLTFFKVFNFSIFHFLIFFDHKNRQKQNQHFKLLFSKNIYTLVHQTKYLLMEN